MYGEYPQEQIATRIDLIIVPLKACQLSAYPYINFTFASIFQLEINFFTALEIHQNFIILTLNDKTFWLHS